MIFSGILFSYLLGSIPTAYIFGKLSKGIDIREHGSGNIGATNVFRVLGKGPGTIVLALDIFKGVLAVTLIAYVFGLTKVWNLIALAIAAVSGHNWTVFLQFKGGKGIATSLGVLIGMSIQIKGFGLVALLVLLVWILSVLITRYISLSSIVAAASLPVLMVLSGQSFELVCFGILICVFVVLRHRPNIKRLLSGQEPRVPLRFGKPKNP